MPVVCLDACEERFDLFVIPFQNLKKVAAAMKQTAFNLLLGLKSHASASNSVSSASPILWLARLRYSS